MKLISVATAGISVWSVYASVIPINQLRVDNTQIVSKEKLENADNSLIHKSVTTYAKDWNENYETYKLHSLLHQPVHHEDDGAKSKAIGDLKKKTDIVTEKFNYNGKKLNGPDSGITEISLNARNNAGNNNNDKEDTSFKPIPRSPNKTQMDLYLIKRDDTAHTNNKLSVDNGLLIIPTSSRVSNNQPSSTIAAKSSSFSSRGVKGINSTRPSSKCISPLGAGFKIPAFNGTSAGAPNSTLSDKSKSSSQDFTNESGVRPISCAVLGITVALAWSTYML
jgi:hypothetical protein